MRLVRKIGVSYNSPWIPCWGLWTVFCRKWGKVTESFLIGKWYDHSCSPNNTFLVVFFSQGSKSKVWLCCELMYFHQKLILPLCHSVFTWQFFITLILSQLFPEKRQKFIIFPFMIFSSVIKHISRHEFYHNSILPSAHLNYMRFHLIIIHWSIQEDQEVKLLFALPALLEEFLPLYTGQEVISCCFARSKRAALWPWKFRIYLSDGNKECNIREGFMDHLLGSNEGKKHWRLIFLQQLAPKMWFSLPQNISLDSNHSQ